MLIIKIIFRFILINLPPYKEFIGLLKTRSRFDVGYSSGVMKVSVVLVIMVFFGLAWAEHMDAQVLINEFMASNTSFIEDPEYHETADWVELYNAGSNAVSLKGYGLTDNISNPEKWIIKDDIQILPGSFVIIWADGMNNGLHTDYKLSADGEELALVQPDLSIADSLIYGYQEVNISYGRKQDGGDEWVYFDMPTPGEPNPEISYEGLVTSYPEFSVEGGVFHNSISVELRTIYGGIVHYTLDGSEPDENSPVTDTPVQITENTVVRARIFKPGQIRGPVATNSYFIDPGHELSNLPIISIASAPGNLWDPDSGLYINHETKPDWEIPVNIELFEKDGRDRAAFNERAGIKLNGLYSWQLPQKMLGVYFRKEYGKARLDYPLFFEKIRKKYDNFSLRASGSDWEYTLFRDGLLQTSVVDYTDIDYWGFRPCVVYINGEFMGIHNMREKIDEDYIVGNHGLEPGTFDMIEEVDGGINVETGDETANNEFLDFTSRDLSIQANFDAVAGIVDIENFTDLVCIEVYSSNSSVAHNLMKWKPQGYGKWKWILMDFDRGFTGIHDQMISYYINESGWPFRELMRNPDFKKAFGLRLSDFLFTTFNPERMISRIEDHKQAIKADIPKQVDRWKGTSGTGNYSNIDAIPSVEYWNAEVERLKTFAQERPATMLNDLTGYGFQQPVSLSVSTSPADAGQLTFNGLKIPVSDCRGGYPKGEEIRLVAEANAGYSFLGWTSGTLEPLIQNESVWKYSDEGTDQGASWKEMSFDDSSWKQGKAELGYGDNDENTVISYGNNSYNKYLTYYFRKEFNLTENNDIQSLLMQLKVDDGAIVYLNNTEVFRINLEDGNVDYQTTANSTVDGSAESAWVSFYPDAQLLQKGNNIVAVEVHQVSGTSSDISFDLELKAQIAPADNFISTQQELVLNTDSEIAVTAVFESDGKCILPDKITNEYILNKDCSPYVCSNDVNISPAGKLIIEPGVEIWMSNGASIYSEGPVIAKGTALEPVSFIGDPEQAESDWGFISISNATDTSFFYNVIIEDASRGLSPREEAAITAYNTLIKFDNISFNNIKSNPITTRFCYVSLSNSTLHSSVTGDLIHVTRGTAHISNCEFLGNELPDNDAIDFDGAFNSLIENCVFHDFFGVNSDAIDLGERASNIKVDGVYVHDITDKGVSVGQWSKVYVSNSVFTNCNMGAGVKDSSFTSIDHCTFYGVNTPVNTYEKVAGRAGGNVIVTNSILSNSYEASYVCDELSTIDISWSASDNDRLPDGKNNLLENPEFSNPTYYDFSLMAGSPCIGSGSSGNMGSGLSETGIAPGVIISDLAYLTESGDDLEFIGIYNPGNSSVDLSGYTFLKGINFSFPDGSAIPPGNKVYVTSDATSPFWYNRGARLYQWESGKLNDGGEAVTIANPYLIIIDEVHYKNEGPWPVPSNTGEAIALVSFDVDNHFGENWILKYTDEIVSVNEVINSLNTFTIYPNPTTGTVYINGESLKGKVLNVYNISGVKVLTFILDDPNPSIKLANLPKGIYLVQCGGNTQKVFLK